MTDNTLLYVWRIFEGLFVCYLIYLLKGVNMHEKVHSDLFYIGRALITSISIAVFCILINNTIRCLIVYIENTSILINITDFFISIWLCIIKDVIIFYTLIIIYLIFLWYKKILIRC